MVWVHFQYFHELLRSLAGERRLVLDETDKFCIERDMLRRSHTLLSTTYKVDPTSQCRPRDGGLLTDSLQKILDCKSASDGQPALFQAIRERDLPSVRFILKKDRALVEAINENAAESRLRSETPLVAAVVRGNVAIVQALLDEFGADPNKVSADGNTPLFECISTLAVKPAEALLLRGARADADVEPSHWLVKDLRRQLGDRVPVGALSHADVARLKAELYEKSGHHLVARATKLAQVLAKA